MIDIVFLALSFFAIGGALAMLLNHNPMYSALGLLICVLSIAGLFALLSATFLFMVQLIVYAGAIMTLVIFLLMFLNINEEDMPKEPNKHKYMILAAIVMIPFNLVIIKAVSNLPNADLSIVPDGFGGIKDVGMHLYTDWLLSFELISILLLVALIGAVVLAKKKKSRRAE